MLGDGGHIVARAIPIADEPDVNGFFKPLVYGTVKNPKQCELVVQRLRPSPQDFLGLMRSAASVAMLSKLPRVSSRSWPE